MGEKYKKIVYCTLQIDGVHRWKDCDIKSVSFLSNPHRHMFGIKAYIEVKHDDRDVEFIDLKHSITEYINEKYYDTNKRTHNFDNKSCEMIAIELINEFNLVKCEVNEDNENGAIVERIY